MPTRGRQRVAGRLPQRNAWCVMVLDITADPVEVVEGEAPAHPLEGDGHAAWDYPEELDVVHDIEEVEIG